MRQTADATKPESQAGPRKADETGETGERQEKQEKQETQETQEEWW